MGVFIYKTKGSFPNNFIMEAVDVLLMAKGSAAEVGYVTDVSLMSDLCDLGLEEYSRGLIHSHVNMATNPSGTDIKELESAASTGPYYLSVIVNNRMEVNALVGIKTVVKGTVKSTIKNLFGKLVNTGSKVVEYEDYEIINCEVVKQDYDLPKYMVEVNERLAKIQDYNTAAHSKRSGYIKSEKAKEKYRQNQAINQRGSQAQLFDDWPQMGGESPLMLQPDDIGDPFEGFIKEALEMYSRYADNTLKLAKDTAFSISNDPYNYGIPNSSFIEYLKKNPYISVGYTAGILAELVGEEVVNGG
jgi:hypothetical protein